MEKYQIIIQTDHRNVVERIYYKERDKRVERFEEGNYYKPVCYRNDDKRVFIHWHGGEGLVAQGPAGLVHLWAGDYFSEDKENLLADILIGTAVGLRQGI